MTRVFRLLLLCLGIAAATAAVAGPRVASGLHDVAHLAAPVAVDEHHHHASDGSVEKHHSHSKPSGEDSDADGGHDHALTGASPVLALDLGVELAHPFGARLAHGLPASVASPPDRGSAPPFQPPRTV
jgi:hypothetical protein